MRLFKSCTVHLPVVSSRLPTLFWLGPNGEVFENLWGYSHDEMVHLCPGRFERDEVVARDAQNSWGDGPGDYNLTDVLEFAISRGWLAASVRCQKGGFLEIVGSSYASCNAGAAVLATRLHSIC